MKGSHTRSRAVRGDASTILPQSRGCHEFIGSQGWERWELEVGWKLGPNHRFVSRNTPSGEVGPLRYDRHAAARHWATVGPDAPGVLS